LLETDQQAHSFAPYGRMPEQISPHQSLFPSLLQHRLLCYAAFAFRLPFQKSWCSSLFSSLTQYAPHVAPTPIFAHGDHALTFRKELCPWRAHLSGSGFLFGTLWLQLPAYPLSSHSYSLRHARYWLSGFPSDSYNDRTPLSSHGIHPSA
uniref:Ovule protein n=1 Tax=Haemonchus placei TaxID=6290 RepID=A0A0N4VSN9_HAEPC